MVEAAANRTNPGGHGNAGGGTRHVSRPEAVKQVQKVASDLGLRAVTAGRVEERITA